MLPSFLIIGAEKSATTFLHGCLCEHPEVFMPDFEVSYFNSPDYYQESIEDFKRLFDASGDKQVIGIKRPNYLHEPECSERIYKHLPDAKLIVLLRDPVDRAISAYFHNASYGFIPVKNVNEGLINIIDGKYKEHYPRSAEIINYGFYYQHLSNYLKYFDMSQFLILLHEDIKASPVESLKKVFRFLNIDKNFIPRSLNNRPQAVLYSLPRVWLRALQSIYICKYSDDNMRLYPKDKLNFMEFSISKFVSLINNSIMRLILSNKKPRLNKELLEKLSNIYIDDTIKLEKLLNRNLSHWKVFQTK